MNILRCHIKGFGKLVNIELAFCPGLNLVFAANEAGKSTLQHFLLALLYGQLREDVPHQRRVESWVDQFKPWTGADYGGILWCRLASGGEVEIARALGREESRIEIRAGSGEEITGKYDRRKNGDVLFARSHLGLPKDLFESVAVIRENKAGEFHGPGNIRERIVNLAQTGDEALSVSQSLKRLQEALEELGSDRAPTRPYRLAQERLRMLREEREKFEARWTEFREWVQERNDYAKDVVLLEEEAQTARKQVTVAKWQESAQKIAVLEKMEVELGVLRQEIAAGSDYESFPAGRLEELNRLVLVRSERRQRMEEVRGYLAQAQEQVRMAAEKRKELAIYAGLDPEKEPEGVTESHIRWGSLSGQINDVQQGVARMRADCVTLEAELDKLGPAFRDAEVDWQVRAQEANDAEREANQKHMAIAEELTRKNASLLEKQGAIIRKRTWATASLVASLAVAAAGLLLPQATLPSTLISFMVALALAAGSFFLFLASSRSRASTKMIVSDMERMRAEQEHIKEAAQKGHFEIGVASVAAGFREVKDFLVAAQRAGEIRRRLEGLQVTIAEAEELRNRLTKESAELLRNIQETLARVGLECSSEDLEGKVGSLRENIKRFRALDAEYQNGVDRERSLLQEESRFLREWNEADARINEILAAAGQVSPESFKEACRKHQLLSALKEKEALLMREYEAHREGRTLEEWKDRHDRLREQLHDVAPARMGPLSLEEAECREKEITALLASCRENHSRLVERIGQAFRDSRTASEIDEDIALAEQDLQHISRNRDALAIALETLEELSRRQQEDLAPRLNRAVEQRFLRLCRWRYHEVKIDPDFQVRVREAVGGELRSAESLSRGTQDQLYFALRFGILDLVSSVGEPCPCLLDEPFAAYDRARLEEAFKILQEEAARRQLILFTCRNDLRDLSRFHDAHVLQLP